MRLKLLAMCFPLLCLSDTCFAEPMSVLEVYEIARETDPMLAMARYQVDGAEAQRDVTRGQMLPQLSIFGDWSENKVRYEGTLTSQIPSQDYPGERYGLQLRAPLFNMRTWKEYERRGALVAQSREKLSLAESDLLGAVVEVYLNVLLADENLAQLQAEFEALEAEVELAEALYSRSLLPVTQLLETQTRKDTLAADVAGAQGQTAIAREKLIQVAGIRNVDPEPVAERMVLTTSVSDIESAAALAMEFDPAIAAASDAVSAARKGISREKGSWLPEIDFVYNSQYSDVGFDNLTSPPRTSESYSVSLRYPLFEGGAGSARLRGAWAEFYTAQQELEEAKRQASGRARAAWVNLNAASERVQATRQAVRTAEVNLDAAKKAVKAGTARVTDVIVALAQNTRAQRDLNQARFQEALGWLELELSTGKDPVALAPRFSSALHGY